MLRRSSTVCCLILTGVVSLSWCAPDGRVSLRGVARILTSEPDGSLSDWFRSEGFWTSQLDIIERSGLNFLELRGVYRLDTGTSTNLFPYLVIDTDQDYVHRPPEEVSANLEMLRQVIDTASDRGIKVAVVNAGFDVEPGDLVSDIGLVMERVDPAVDFDWEGRGPAEGFETDHFAARWTGFITVPETGEYTFFTQADDGTRLWVDGKRLIDDWGTMHGVLEKSGKLRLEAGRRYSIRLDYLEIMYAAVVRLLWQPPGGEKAIVPSEYLSPSEGEGHGLSAEYFTKRMFARQITARSAQELVEQCPGISHIGFEAGGDPRAWEDAVQIYSPALDAATEAALICHAGSAPAKLLNGLRSDFPGGVTVLADWNGDHLGLPYPALRDHDPTRSCLRDFDKRESQLLWRLGGGTHRVFPWMDPRFIRSCARNTTLFGGVGFVWEPIGCYGPQACNRIYRATPDGNPPWRWLHERDALTYRAWGLFGVDPEADAGVLREEFKRSVGGDEQATRELYDGGLTCITKTVPTIASMHCVGLTLETFAPELETGNDRRTIDWFIHVPPMDPARWFSISESVRNRPTAESRRRMGPTGEMYSLGFALSMDCALPKPHSLPGDQRWLAYDLRSVEELGDYYTYKTSAAERLETYYQTGCVASLTLAEEALQSASEHWEKLIAIAEQQYQPFIEVGRMRTQAFSWADGRKEIEADLKRIAELQEETEDVSGLVIRHDPVYRARPGLSPALSCTVLGDERPDVVLEYRCAGDSGRIDRPVGGSWWRIPDADLQAGTLEYRFVATAGDREATWPLEGWQKVVVSDDFEAPRLEVSLPEGGSLRVRATKDVSGVREVRVYYYSLMDGQPMEWVSGEMEADKDGIFRDQLPAFPCAWRIEAVDGIGNVSHWPGEDPPYRLKGP